MRGLSGDRYMSIQSMFDLKGKTIIITGGSGYLGKAMSEALVAFGANLFIVGSNAEKNSNYARYLKEKYINSNCEGLCVNIDDEKSINKAFEYIYTKTGSIDVLVNNAAYSRAGRVENISNDDWCKGIDGTINGVFRTTKVALKYMIHLNKGNIINIASMYGVVAPDPSIYGDSGYDNPANYGAGKAAIIQFTRYIAATYGNIGIRANAISPGTFPSETVQTNEMFVKRLCAKNPMGRIGVPSDLQGIVVFLVSDSSRYLTGQNIAVDGGWTSW